MKTILITGAAGLIGKTVAGALLQKGFNVIGTDKAPSPFEDNPNFSYIQCSVTDKDKINGIINGSKIDMLLHLACTADNDFPDVFGPAEEKESSAADKYLFRSAESAGIADIIMISTYQVYAVQKTREPIRETADEKPVTVYAKIKACTERALANALKKSRTKGVIMRVCPVYTKDFTDNLKAKVFDEKENCGYVYGYGDYSYCFTCVHNISDFVYGILTADEKINYTGIYNVCDTKNTAAKDIIEFLRGEHKIGAVLTRNYSTENVKNTIFGSKEAKTNYRYNDISVACSNITYDNTKAQRIATFRWKLSNTK
ncbi:MAG: NAD(P)-dependent oxidoreductase [Ruminococcus sp.]|nr:NAD(P)-dependent oxidoreductase [Ruminococcus sp.]